MHLKGDFSECDKVTTNIADLFAPVECTGRPYTLLIEGAPGIGKTILAKEIVFRWANGTLLKTERLVFLIYLRDPKTQTISTFESFINYISYSQISKSIEQYVSSVSGKGVTLLFDGYDEYPEGLRDNSYLSNVISHEVFELQSCNIIITSRPSASACLRNNIDLRVEILGFTKEHRKSYIVHALKDNPNAIQDLLEYLESNYSVDAYCHIPLSMAILVFLFKESGYDKTELPTTQTAINYKFICIIIRRFIKKFQKEPLTISKFSVVPKPYKQILLEISKLAFKALQEDRIVFSASEISGICPGLLQDSKHWNGLDLLKAVQYFNLEENADELSFNFLHFSVQELLAAYHISLMSTGQQIRLLKETFWNTRYFNAWIMYVALTKDRPFAFKHFLSGNRLRISTKFSLWWSGNAFVSIAKNMKESKIKCLHLFQCFTEAGNDEMCHYVSSLLQDGTIDLSGQALSAVDLYTLSSFLARCVQRQWNILDLSHCYLDDENFETFCKSYASLTKSVIYINTIDLSFNIFTQVSASQIANLILNFNAKKLVLASNEIHDLGIDQATFGALLEHPNMIQSRFITIQDENTVNLVLYKRGLDNSIASELFIMWYSTIEAYKDVCLYIESNGSFFENLINTHSASIFKTVLHSLVRKMALFSTDFKFHVKTINSTNEVIKSIISSLASNIPLAVRMGENCLPLHLCNIPNDVIGESDSFDRLGTIFFCSRFSFRTMYCMFYFVLSKANLNQIYLNGVVLYDYSIYVSTRFTGKPLVNYLELVYFYAHDITTTNVLANVLPQVINMTRSLKHLNLSACRFKIKHTIVILKALKQVTGLKTIAISDNHLSKVTCDILSSVIICNRELQCIELSNCNLQASEIKSITNALQSCKDLQSLDLSNNVIIDDVVCNVAEVIENCQSFKDLRLQSCQLHYTGIQEIAEAMVNKTSLHSIDLSNNAISNQNAMLINNIIVNNRDIQRLDFSSCELKSTGCQQLLQGMAKITSLVHLDLSNNLFTDVVVDNFTLVIHQNVSLEYLNISGCCDEVKDFEKITHSLVNLKSLNHLDLSCNVINITSAENIAIIITNNTFLEDFNLSRCAIGNSAFKNIIFALQNNHHLKYLHLKFNSKEGITTVISNNRFLENIDLSNCNLTEKEMKSILSSLRNHTSLKHLDINSNSITNHVINEIVDVIDNNTQLTYLNISDTNIQEYGVLKIFKAVRRINTLKSIKICNCTISDQAAQTIADAISVNCIVEELVFTNNDFHETGISMIFDVLRKTYRLKCLTIASNDVISNITTKITEVVSNGHIAYFNLSNCDLQKRSCLSILDSLILQAPSLQHIDLSHNNLNGIAKSIAQLISVSYYLQYVNLGNTLMTDKEIIIIVKAMQTISSLRYVDLTSYSINDELAVEVINAIGKSMAMNSFKISKLCVKKFEAAITTLNKSILNILINLQQITICFNDCENDLVNVAVSLINNSPNLQYLHLENCSLVEININNVIVALMRTTTLEYLCLVNFVIADRTDDRIAAIIQNNIHLKNFKLAGCKLTEEGLARSIQSFNMIKLSHLVLSNMDYLIDYIMMQLKKPICNSLTHLNLSNVNLDSTKLSYLCLPYLTKLQHLDLSHNPLTDESANILSSIILNNNGLQHLYLCNCKLQSEGIRVVANSLQAISVVYIDMSLNTINNDTFNNDLMPALLCSVRTMKYLALPCCELKQKEIDKLFDKATFLKFIDIGPNVISKSTSNLFKDIVFVSKEYKQISCSTGGLKQISSINCDIENFYHSLNYLDISDITIDDQIGNTVASLIANSPELEHLEMAGGEWSSTYAMKCLKALRNNSCLTHFNFSNNSNNFNFTLIEILYLLNGCSSLKILNLENCCRLRNRKIVSVTNESPTLMQLNYLDLNNNLIDDEAADYLAILISTNVGLEYLNFCNCELSSSGIQKIYNALIVASSLKFFYVNFDDTYIKGLDYSQVVTLLAANKQLERLGLSELVLDNTKLHQIQSHLCVVKRLRRLVISDCNFTDKDTGTIISLIANNPTLRELALLNCEMSIRNKLKFSFIGAALDQQYLKLDTITIANSINMTNQYSLNTNIPLHCSVSKLTLTNNDVVAVMTVDNNLGELIMFKLIVDQDSLTVLSTNTVTIRYLKILHIQDCTFTDYDAHYVAFLINTNAATIQNFNFTSCKLSISQKAIICKALCKLNITLLLHLNIREMTYREMTYTDVKNETNKSLRYANCKLNDNIVAAVMTDHTNLFISKLVLNHETLPELKGSLNLIKGVTYLTIDGYALNDVIGESVFANNDHIQEFMLSNCSFPQKYLEKLLFTRTLNLVSFDRICFPQINEDLLDFIITNNPGLNHFTMCMCEIAEGGLARIMHSITTALRSLLHINFSHLKCSCEVAKHITTVISCNTKLKHINLYNCQLPSVDVKSIIRAARNFTDLEYFDLSCNDVTDGFVKNIATLIANNKNIKKLSLPDYTLLISNDYLKVVLNTVTDLLVNDIASLVMATCKSITELSLVNCYLSDDQSNVIRNAVKDCSTPPHFDYIIVNQPNYKWNLYL